LCFERRPVGYRSNHEAVIHPTVILTIQSTGETATVRVDWPEGNDLMTAGQAPAFSFVRIRPNIRVTAFQDEKRSFAMLKNS